MKVVSIFIEYVLVTLDLNMLLLGRGNSVVAKLFFSDGKSSNDSFRVEHIGESVFN